MNNQTSIEKNVMRRVRLIRALRPVTSYAALSALVLLLALWGIGREVWVARVFANGPQDLIGHSLYLFYAFEHTRLLVQALSVLTLGSLIYLARETARLISGAVAPTRTA
jgi:hypothetical protein